MHFGDGNITLVDTVKYFVLLRLTVSFQATMLLYYLCQGRDTLLLLLACLGQPAGGPPGKMAGKTECVTINTFT